MNKKAKRKTKLKERGFDTNADLRYMYLKINKSFFGNRLPKDMSVSFEKIKGDLGRTRIDGRTFRPLYIEITDRIRFSAALCYQTLLHEMVHVSVPEHRGHRGWFDKEMLKLVNKGVMNGMW
jgi:hypothetical protein